MTLFDALIDDARLLTADPASISAGIQEYRQCLDGPAAAVVGRLMVPDTRLTAAARSLPSGPVIPVSVINSGGAGGIVSLVGRLGSADGGLQVVAVESAIRDLDDPVANTQRILSAVDALGADLEVYVELPYAPGWQRAVEVVEAAGHFGKLDGTMIDLDEREGGLAEQLSVMIEADLAFKITLPVEPIGSAYSLLRLLDSVAALIDGATVAEAAALLRRRDDRLQSRAAENAWDAAAQQRIRRRVSRVSGPVLAP